MVNIMRAPEISLWSTHARIFNLSLRRSAPLNNIWAHTKLNLAGIRRKSEKAMRSTRREIKNTHPAREHWCWACASCVFLIDIETTFEQRTGRRRTEAAGHPSPGQWSAGPRWARRIPLQAALNERCSYNWGGNYKIIYTNVNKITEGWTFLNRCFISPREFNKKNISLQYFSVKLSVYHRQYRRDCK